MTIVTSIDELTRYNRRLLPGREIHLVYRTWARDWEAIVCTEGNHWPHWQAARAKTAGAAWRRLRRFLDGGRQLHGNLTLKAEDFIRRRGGH